MESIRVFFVAQMIPFPAVWPGQDQRRRRLDLQHGDAWPEKFRQRFSWEFKGFSIVRVSYVMADGALVSSINNDSLTSPSPRIVNIKGDTKPADRCDVETLKGTNLRIRFRWGMMSL